MCVERPSCFRSSCGQVEFPPDLCSRVTFVNFTVTRGSLQSQCLNQVLKAERPDVDAKRSDLLKLQGMLLPRRCKVLYCLHEKDKEIHAIIGSQKVMHTPILHF